jgi:formylglycine-generating enzyme required for sulfatase activity
VNKFDLGFRVVRGVSPAVRKPAGMGAQSRRPAPANAPFDAKQAGAFQETWATHSNMPVERTDKAGVRLRLIPAGEFEMGQTPDEIKALLETEPAANDVEVNDLKTEAPRHRVRISRPFYLGEREITVAQFRKFVDASKYKTDAERDGFGGAIFDEKQMKLISKPEINWREPGFKTQGEQRPVCQVSWNDAVAFCRWLSQQESASYRLPTEAEWEFACRAGTATTFYFGDDPAELQYNAWIAPQSEGEAHPGGTKLPNAFGLCDMIGNVREWCQDVWDPSYYAASPAVDPPGPAKGLQRVVRGSYWIRTGSALEHHSGLRRSAGPSSRSWYQGFRVVREVPQPLAK